MLVTPHVYYYLLSFKLRMPQNPPFNIHIYNKCPVGIRTPYICIWFILSSECPRIHHLAHKVQKMLWVKTPYTCMCFILSSECPRIHHFTLKIIKIFWVRTPYVCFIWSSECPRIHHLPYRNIKNVQVWTPYLYFLQNAPDSTI